jgi:hypothetical protein
MPPTLLVPAKAPRRNRQRGVELARQVLERDQRRQLDHGLLVEVRAQPCAARVAHPLARIGRRLGIGERRRLALGKERGGLESFERGELLGRYLALERRRRVEIDAEGTS